MILPEVANPSSLYQPQLVLFYIQHADYHFVYRVAAIHQWIVGRRNSRDGFFPDIDLTDFGAGALGVSRRHAILSSLDNQFVTITDYYSASGVFVNGCRVVVGASRTLYDGDIVKLGRMRLHITYANGQL